MEPSERIASDITIAFIGVLSLVLFGMYNRSYRPDRYAVSTCRYRNILEASITGR